MSQSLPLVTVVIATFNSSAVLGRTLDAVKRQSYPADRLEILLVDGGSTDDTVQIGLDRGARVIPNPQTQPVYAKYLALHDARGNYILYLDHDEVIQSESSIERKVRAMQDGGVHSVIGSGYCNPPEAPGVNDYINEFGDPFSAFVYRLSKHHRFFSKTMVRRYDRVESTDEYDVFDFSGATNLPLIELCAGGSMIDLDYLRAHVPEALETPDRVPHIFYMMLPHCSRVAMTKNDPLMHYSADTLAVFHNKIRWRIKNNIYFADMGKSGFSGRQEYGSTALSIRKLLFLPYAFTLLFPLLSGIWMTVTRRNAIYLAHVWFCLFTASLIVGHKTLHTFGYRPKLKSYDEKVVVETDEAPADTDLSPTP